MPNVESLPLVDIVTRARAAYLPARARRRPDAMTLVAIYGAAALARIGTRVARVVDAVLRVR